MAAHNLQWVRSPVTCGIRPGWVDTIFSIEVMAPGLVSEGFLIDPLECLPFVTPWPLVGLSKYLDNTMGGGV